MCICRISTNESECLFLYYIFYDTSYGLSRCLTHFPVLAAQQELFMYVIFTTDKENILIKTPICCPTVHFHRIIAFLFVKGPCPCHPPSAAGHRSSRGKLAHEPRILRYGRLHVISSLLADSCLF
jgi:hypothetical protein